MRTAKQKAALRKAQLASARKRRGRGRSRVAVSKRKSSGGSKLKKAAAIGAYAAYVGYVAHNTHRTAKDFSREGKNPKLVYGAAGAGLLIGGSAAMVMRKRRGRKR